MDSSVIISQYYNFYIRSNLDIKLDLYSFEKVFVNIELKMSDFVMVLSSISTSGYIVSLYIHYR